MMAGNDERFDAIYSSIDEDYEPYVQVINSPAPYLVPQKAPQREEQGTNYYKSITSILVHCYTIFRSSYNIKQRAILGNR